MCLIVVWTIEQPDDHDGLEVSFSNIELIWPVHYVVLNRSVRSDGVHYLGWNGRLTCDVGWEEWMFSVV